MHVVSREHFLAVLRGESNDVISWTMGFFDEKLAAALLGEDCIPSDILPGPAFSYGASPRHDWEVKARFSQRAEIPAVAVGWGASLSFGHGGPGEFLEKVTSATGNRRLTVYETGVHKEVRYEPHFYHNYDYPLDNLNSLGLPLPDPNDPLRYQGLADEVAHHKARNRMTYANLNGFFSGVHYFLYPYDKLLMDLLLEPKATKDVVDQLGSFNLQVARHLLQAGVDIICFCDDLGSDRSLLISPGLYREFFLPWHWRLVELCHSYDAIVHMHSHGNINAIMDDLYSIGIDLLNPVDPAEEMDLARLVEAYGDRMTFVGGINKFFFGWDEERQWDYLKHLYESVKQGFFLMDSGGIPEQVSKTQWERYKEMKQTLGEKRRFALSR
ncbi:MAG TPA: hypothetical protein DDW87_04105 [Firmicutes bacterium]|nr:hypothetical protein [Bacillota bacterium]